MATKTKSAMASAENFNSPNLDLVKDNIVADAVYKIISEITPKLNSLVEVNIAQISESFANIASLFKKVSGEINPEVAQEIDKNIGSAIMGMQFQDRLSQNLVIIKNITDVLMDNISETSKLSQSSANAVGESFNLDLAKKIIENLKLGELRDIFVARLISEGHIKSIEDLGIAVATEEEKQKLEDDIELF